MIPISTTSKQDWGTPDVFYNLVDSLYGPFDLDAAATAKNKKCAQYFSRRNSGLRNTWKGRRVWCNPPYARGQLELWTAKAASEASVNGTFSALLIPAATSAKWWHTHVIPHARIHFVQGRLRFKGAESPAPFGSAVCVYGPDVKAGTGEPINARAAA
ncbi:MAG: adenine methyltransferase [Magnetovibrio sp.]|nr:adenine methyltransferase [Magnetovibrio sp.]|tara:strand:- start:2474 stop:2947 length:474 start_codon:yes stop_codon:yes gene_type:complete